MSDGFAYGNEMVCLKNYLMEYLALSAAEYSDIEV